MQQLRVLWNETNKQHSSAEHKEKWEEKRMNGQFPRSLDEKLVDKEES